MKENISFTALCYDTAADDLFQINQHIKEESSSEKELFAIDNRTLVTNI